MSRGPRTSNPNLNDGKRRPAYTPLDALPRKDNSVFLSHENTLDPDLAVLLLLSAGVAAEPLEAPSPRAFRVIVHPTNPISSVQRSFVADVFLQKVTRWSNGELIKPADLSRASPIRRRFTEEVLGRSLLAVRSYWQQQIFSGRDFPPPELDSDAAAVSFVLKYPGAISYIAANTDPGGAKILTVK